MHLCMYVCEVGSVGVPSTGENSTGLNSTQLYSAGTQLDSIRLTSSSKVRFGFYLEMNESNLCGIVHIKFVDKGRNIFQERIDYLQICLDVIVGIISHLLADVRFHF
jgi:hypothetical protein